MQKNVYYTNTMNIHITNQPQEQSPPCRNLYKDEVLKVNAYLDARGSNN